MRKLLSTIICALVTLHIAFAQDCDKADDTNHASLCLLGVFTSNPGSEKKTDSCDFPDAVAHCYNGTCCTDQTKQFIKKIIDGTTKKIGEAGDIFYYKLGTPYTNGTGGDACTSTCKEDPPTALCSGDKSGAHTFVTCYDELKNHKHKENKKMCLYPEAVANCIPEKCCTETFKRIMQKYIEGYEDEDGNDCHRNIKCGTSSNNWGTTTSTCGDDVVLKEETKVCVSEINSSDKDNKKSCTYPDHFAACFSKQCDAHTKSCIKTQIADYKNLNGVACTSTCSMATNASTGFVAFFLAAISLMFV